MKERMTAEEEAKVWGGKQRGGRAGLVLSLSDGARTIVRGD